MFWTMTQPDQYHNIIKTPQSYKLRSSSQTSNWDGFQQPDQSDLRPVTSDLFFGESWRDQTEVPNDLKFLVSHWDFHDGWGEIWKHQIFSSQQFRMFRVIFFWDGSKRICFAFCDHIGTVRCCTPKKVRVAYIQMFRLYINIYSGGLPNKTS